MAVLLAEDLVMRFGSRLVLDGVSLALSEKDGWLVRGRSGSGKSTLLHLLAGIGEPTSGRVVVAGEDLRALDPSSRARLRLEKVGLVFQDFSLIPDLTAEENVRLPLALARKGNRREKSHALLAQVGLADHARAFPGSMSGGEMQRVAIARALANDPAAVLADEPTASLDEENARTVFSLLAGLATEGRAILVASHDAVALEFFRNRRQLVGGRLTELSTPHPG